MTEINDEAVATFRRNVCFDGTNEGIRAGLRAALPHLRSATVDVERRETMREAAEIAWANYGHTNENLGWFAVVDAVLALVPKAEAPDAASPHAPDQRLAAVEKWRDCWLGARSSADGIRALHSLLSELRTRVAALERGR